MALGNIVSGNTPKIGWYPKYRVIPQTPGLPKILGYTRYFGLPATRWFSKLNRVGSGIEWNTEYQVGFGYPLGTGSHPLRSLHRQSEQDVRVKHTFQQIIHLRSRWCRHNFINKPPLSVPEPRSDSNLGLHRCRPSPRSLLHLCHQVGNFNSEYCLFLEFICWAHSGK